MHTCTSMSAFMCVSTCPSLHIYTIIIIIRFCLLSTGWMLWISTSFCFQHFLYILYSLSLTSLILFIHIILGLPLPIFSTICASNNSLCMLLGLFDDFINLRLVFIILSTSSLDLCSFHNILNICLYVHISKASNLLVKVFVKVHVSAP